MTPAVATPGTNGSRQAEYGLRRYAEALSAPRKVRQRLLGPDTDPDFCLTDFLFAVRRHDEPRLKSVYGATRTKAPLGQASGPAGGYLVPERLNLELMRDVGEDALVRPRAAVVPMTTSSVRLPLPDATTAPSAGTTPFFGGVKLSWTGEGQTRPETEPAFREVDLRAWDLTGYALQSMTLYQDGGAGVEAFLRKLFARSIAWYEDYAYLQGDGVGKPQGVLGCPGAAVVNRNGSNAFDNAHDVANMSKALLPGSWAKAIWLVSPTVWPQLVVMGSGASGASPSWQANQPIMEGAGRPHFYLNGQFGWVTEKLPALGTKGDVILFDPSLYVIGDRGAVEIVFSEDEPTAYKNYQGVWRVTYRGDGQPWFSKTVTLSDGATVVSPYVVLN